MNRRTIIKLLGTGTIAGAIGGGCYRNNNKPVSSVIYKSYMHYIAGDY